MMDEQNNYSEHDIVGSQGSLLDEALHSCRKQLADKEEHYQRLSADFDNPCRSKCPDIVLDQRWRICPPVRRGSAKLPSRQTAGCS